MLWKNPDTLKRWRLLKFIPLILLDDFFLQGCVQEFSAVREFNVENLIFYLGVWISMARKRKSGVGFDIWSIVRLTLLHNFWFFFLAQGLIIKRFGSGGTVDFSMIDFVPCSRNLIIKEKPEVNKKLINIFIWFLFYTWIQAWFLPLMSESERFSFLRDIRCKNCQFHSFHWNLDICKNA